jgi:hypothetical protein
VVSCTSTGELHERIYAPHRLFRRAALAGQTFACPDEIALATRVATCQLNARARPWVWGRPRPSPRYRRHVLTYRI